MKRDIHILSDKLSRSFDDKRRETHKEKLRLMQQTNKQTCTYMYI